MATTGLDIKINRKKVTYQSGYGPGVDGDQYPSRSGACTSYVSMDMSARKKDNGKYEVNIKRITYWSESYNLTSTSANKRNGYPLCMIFTLCNKNPDSSLKESFKPTLYSITGSSTVSDSRIPVWYYSSKSDTYPLEDIVIIKDHNNSNEYYTSSSDLDTTYKKRIIEVARKTVDTSVGNFITNEQLFGENNYDDDRKGYIVNQTDYPGVGWYDSSTNKYYIKDENKNMYSRIIKFESDTSYFEVDDLTTLKSAHVWINMYTYFSTDDGIYNCWQGWEDAGTFNTWVTPDNCTISYNSNGYLKPGDTLPSSTTQAEGTTYQIPKGLQNYSQTTEYIITFNSNGGSVSSGSATFRKTVTHTFGGWKYYGITYQSGNRFTVIESVELEAIWSHNTSYELVGLNNFPTPSKTCTLSYKKSINTDQVTFSKSSDTLSFSFLGWYTSSSSGTRVTIDNAGRYITSNRTLYAHWSSSVSVSPSSLPTVTYSTGYRRSRDDSNNDKWTTSSSGNAVFNGIVQGSMDIYLKCEYEVLIDPNGGVLYYNGNRYTSSASFWKIFNQNLTIPNDPDYFIYTENEGNITGDESTIKTYKGLSTNRNADPDSSLIISSTYTNNTPATYYAIYKPNTYTVTFDANGGKFSDNTTEVVRTVNYGENALVPSVNPTRPGFTFLEWVGNYAAVKSDQRVMASWDFVPIWIRNSSNKWVKYEPPIN